MSHYPSTAELAKFRGSLHAAMPPHHADDCTILPPVDDLGYFELGAWPDERSHGIGYSLDAERIWQRDGWSVGDAARREASRMRSRAFAAHVATGPWPIGHGYEDGSRVCPIERSNGLPVEIGHYA